MTTPIQVPKGFCRCGCGRRTKLATHNDASKGWVKGHPLKFILGHTQRLPRAKSRIIVVEGVRCRTVPLTKGYEAIVNIRDWYRVRRYYWYADTGSSGIVYAARDDYASGKIMKMHIFILNPPNGMNTDHINGNGLDNRRCNLRPATDTQNMINRIKQASKSRYRGVTWAANHNNWFARIKLKGVVTHLGCFVNEIDAAISYDKAARSIFGSFAQLNFPQEGEHGVRY